MRGDLPTGLERLHEPLGVFLRDKRRRIGRGRQGRKRRDRSKRKRLVRLRCLFRIVHTAKERFLERRAKGIDPHAGKKLDRIGVRFEILDRARQVVAQPPFDFAELLRVIGGERIPSELQDTLQAGCPRLQGGRGDGLLQRHLQTELELVLDSSEPCRARVARLLGPREPDLFDCHRLEYVFGVLEADEVIVVLMRANEHVDSAVRRHADVGGDVAHMLLLVRRLKEDAAIDQHVQRRVVLARKAEQEAVAQPAAVHTHARGAFPSRRFLRRLLLGCAFLGCHERDPQIARWRNAKGSAFGSRMGSLK